MRIVILHFRSGPGVHATNNVTMDAGESAGTDGVSLEMAKRANLLGEMGHEPAIASAYDWADIPIPELEFEEPAVVELMHRLFDSRLEDSIPKDRLGPEVIETAERLRAHFQREISSFHPQLLFVHNVFSLPIHPAATIALADFVRDSGIPCAAIHHDVRSEGAYKFTPTCRFARRLLVDYFPPEMPNVRHWAINSRDRAFFRERGIPAGVINDTLNFEKRLTPTEREKLRIDLRKRWGVAEEDIVLLVSTRIVPNKQVEIAGWICRQMEDLKGDFIGKRLYNGAPVTDRTRIILILSGRPERAFRSYRDAVFDLYRRLSITWQYVGDSIMPRRNEDSKQYALYPDSYAAADFALYPTRWEGFGNQFLEIVASELPVAVYEYPIFTSDLAPHGFDYVSLGSQTTIAPDSPDLAALPRERLTAASRRIWEILTDSEAYTTTAERNLAIGATHFGLPLLRTHLEEVTAWAAQLIGL